MLTAEDIAVRRNKRPTAQRVTFSVKALYGVSRESIRMPLNRTESIDSGQICVTIDPDADHSGNLGVIDFADGKLRVRYAAQMVFPGLYGLVLAGGHDPSFLHPVRAVATDDCTLTSDLSGWHALGCLDFLPGSIWAGASGG
jgi:hypothetical protein